jgi:hypothetical protein
VVEVVDLQQATLHLEWKAVVEVVDLQQPTLHL